MITDAQIDRELADNPDECMGRRRIARNRILQRQAIEREKRGTRSVFG